MTAAPVSRLALLRSLSPTPPPAAQRAGVVHLPTGSGGDSPYGLAALAGICRDVAQTAETGGRDVAFNRACLRAGDLIRDGDLTRATAEAELRAAGLAVTDPSDFTAYKVEEKLARVIDQGIASSYVIDKAPLEPVPTLRPYYPPEQPPQVGPGDTAVLEGTDWVHSGTGEVVGTAVAPDAVERTSWWPRNVAGLLAGDVEEEPAPAFLARTDGHRLFYAGKVNALIGESESGKTWVGLLTVKQALDEGQTVLYLDYEDTLPGIVGRLRALGVTDARLARLIYISPDEDLDVPQRRDLAETIAATPPDLILFDGVNAAMTLLGLDLEKNKDATEFSLRLLRPLKRTGACVVTIDHVTKSKDNRGSYAIGAQAKRADIDGCALMVEVVTPFGRGMTGRLKLTVSKDRPGHVRAVSTGAKNAGTAVLVSAPDGSVRAEVEAPDLRPAEERGRFRPTVLMERVSGFLASMTLPAGSDGASKKAVESAVTGNRDGIRDALDVLVDEGFVERTTTPGGVFHRSIKVYTQALDPMADQPRPLAQGSPNLAQGRGSPPSPTRPPPYGGARARGTGTLANPSDPSPSPNDHEPDGTTSPNDPDEPEERYR